VILDIKGLLAGLPNRPGVYRMLDKAGEMLYVGKAKSLKKRVASYFQKGELAPRVARMVGQVAKVEVTVTRSEGEALLLENNLIKSEKPRYNILFRDDKSYPYLLLTAHPFPRLAFFRGNPPPGARAFGPFPSAHAVRESMQVLQQVFRLRTCEDTVFSHRSRPCLLYQIKRCTAPCVGHIDAANYGCDANNAAQFLRGRQEEVVERLTRDMQDAADALRFEDAARLRDQIQSLARVRQKQFVESSSAVDADVIACAIAGGATCVNLIMVRAGRRLGDRSFFPINAGGETEATVLEAYVSQHYLEIPPPELIVVGAEGNWDSLAHALTERHGHAVRIHTGSTQEARQWLEMARANAEVAIAQHLSAQATQEERLAALQEALDMPQLGRIECFDISHTQGEATVASCVVYDQGGMRKSEYRRFSIAGITPGDDYAAMNAVLSRRYKRIVAGEGRLPDLILIDGGKGQVKAAIAALADLGLNGVPVVGVAKGENRRPGLETLVFPDRTMPLKLPADHPGLHLIQTIRDEAHRFAIAGHRARRGKARSRSILEDIEGVGHVRRQRLLTRFGGLNGLLAAGAEELAQVKGISRGLAERIYRQLH
jgi:excinuclease ABC subunit C